jgi:2-oxoglutarate ferredoxin oxidoreductase subunit beta
MLHDGSWVRLRKIAEDYDPTDRDRSYTFIRDRQMAGEIATGLLYISADSVEMQDQLETVSTPLVELPFEELCPGAVELDKLQRRFR